MMNCVFFSAQTIIRSNNYLIVISNTIFFIIFIILKNNTYATKQRIRYTVNPFELKFNTNHPYMCEKHISKAQFDRIKITRDMLKRRTSLSDIFMKVKIQILINIIFKFFPVYFTKIIFNSFIFI